MKYKMPVSYTHLYGIPQNRERVYLILIQKEMDNGTFQIPEPLECFQCLMDILEDTVEEKYYLSQEKVRRLIEDMEERKDRKSTRLNSSHITRSRMPSSA